MIANNVGTAVAERGGESDLWWHRFNISHYRFQSRCQIARSARIISQVHQTTPDRQPVSQSVVKSSLNDSQCCTDRVDGSSFNWI